MLLAVIIFFTASLFICLYAYTIGYLWLKSQKKTKERTTEPLKTLPTVTVQLPVYNEKLVINTLLQSINRLNYPAELLHVQILDDSTDQTSQIIKQFIENQANKNINWQHIQRPNRTGFKAGALAYGLEKTPSELIAIFDADFCPDPDFLQNTIHYFHDESIAAVQTRWAHINANESIFTKLQALALNMHFFVEQNGRHRQNLMLNFNGTAGIWRKKSIILANNWHADTLTEDLDLSYRVQLLGQKIYYIDHVETKSELPAAMPAIRSQQFRWNKGGAQCAKKHLLNVLNSKLSFKQKWHGTLHLLNSSIFLFGTLLAISSLYINIFSPEKTELSKLLYASLLLSGYPILGLMYAGVYKKTNDRWYIFFGYFFLFLTVSLGFSILNTWAVLQGWLNIQTPFVRTPKMGNSLKKSTDRSYLSRKIPPMVWGELLLSAVFLYSAIVGQHFFIYHLMLCLGLGGVAITSIVHYSHR